MESVSIWSYFGLSLGFGLLSLLTPCVFPLIPITVSYFLKREEDRQRNSLLESVIYSVGIVVSFSLLGLIIAFFFGAARINQLAANPFLNLGIGFLFLFFAFNLMGFFEIRLPSFLILYLSKDKQMSGYGATLLMSFTFTLTTFTCTMPFLGTVLISASKGDWFFPVVGMLGYSLAFAFPFFLLSLFPSFLQKLPRSGNWMLSVKIVMGFLEIAASLKFFSNADLVWNLGILSRDLVLVLLFVLFCVLAIYLFGLFRFSHESSKNQKISNLRKTFAVFVLGIALFFLFGITGFRMGELEAYLPPRGYGKIVVSEKSRSLHWIKSLEEAKKFSLQSGKPIFIDFTGFTCVNCRWMEENIFSREEIKSALSRYVLVQLYTDGDGQEYDDNQAYQEKKFSTIALPLYAIIDYNENILDRFEGMSRDPKDFEKFLEKGFSNN